MTESHFQPGDVVVLKNNNSKFYTVISESKGTSKLVDSNGEIQFLPSIVLALYKP